MHLHYWSYLFQSLYLLFQTNKKTLVSQINCAKSQFGLCHIVYFLLPQPNMSIYRYFRQSYITVHISDNSLAKLHPVVSYFPQFAIWILQRKNNWIINNWRQILSACASSIATSVYNLKQKNEINILIKLHIPNNDIKAEPWILVYFRVYRTSVKICTKFWSCEP